MSREIARGQPAGAVYNALRQDRGRIAEEACTIDHGRLAGGTPGFRLIYGQREGGDFPDAISRTTQQCGANLGGGGCKMIGGIS
ncbi:MAG: hypothetical protein M1404_02100 [Acidobacteria bacterium]|nr:hypothetical protein [Acidobacteriota bacterium]